MTRRVRLREIAEFRAQPDPNDLMACVERISDPILYLKNEWFSLDDDVIIIDLDILTQVVILNRAYWVRSPAWSFIHKLVKNGRRT